MALKPGEQQTSMIVPNVEELIPANHRYRKLLTLLDGPGFLPKLPYAGQPRAGLE